MCVLAHGWTKGLSFLAVSGLGVTAQVWASGSGLDQTNFPMRAVCDSCVKEPHFQEQIEFWKSLFIHHLVSFKTIDLQED